MLTLSLEVRTPRGATKIAPPPGDFRHDPQIPSRPLLDVGSLVSSPLDPAADPSVVVDEVGVQSKHRARQFVTKLWVSDRKGNFHLATCLCDNGSEVNLQSNSFLPDDCVFESPHPVTLEGVSGHSLAGGQHGCYISTHLVAQDLWEEGNVEEVILKNDYFYRADIKYDLYLGHPWLSKNRVA